MSEYANFAGENPPVDTNLSKNHEPVLTEKMLRYLQDAAPWLRLVGIVGFVFVGLTFVSLLVMAGYDSFQDYSFGTGFNSGPFVIITTLPFLVVGFFGSFFTFQFGNKIKLYHKTKDQTELENAFKNNKSLWTLSGVVCVICLAFVLLAVLTGIIAGFITNSW